MRSLHFRNEAKRANHRSGLGFVPRLLYRFPLDGVRIRASAKRKEPSIRETIKPVLEQAKLYPRERRNERALWVLAAIVGGTAAFLLTGGAILHLWGYHVPVLALLIPPALAFIINQRTPKTRLFRKIPKDLRLLVINIAETYETVSKLREYVDRTEMLAMLGKKEHPGRILAQYGILFLDLLNQDSEETGDLVTTLYNEDHAYVQTIGRVRKALRGVLEYLGLLEAALNDPTPLPTVEEATKLHEELTRLSQEKPQTLAVARLLQLKDHHDRPLTRALPAIARQFFHDMENFSKIHHVVIYSVILDILEIVENYSKALDALENEKFLKTFDKPALVQKIKAAIGTQSLYALDKVRTAFDEHINKVRPPKPGSPIPDKFMEANGLSYQAFCALRSDLLARLDQSQLQTYIPPILEKYRAFQNLK